MIEIDWELLFRCVCDECSEDERARFEAWLASNPMHSIVLEAARTAAGRTLDALPSSRRVVRTTTMQQPRSASAWRPRLAVAAAAGLVIAIGTTVLQQRTRFALRENAVPPHQVATTGRGQRATLYLSDGTMVILGPASSLRYPASFAAASSRELYLTGEAYFEVVHDAQRPLRVHAGGAIAEDLGTKFDVRAYAGDSAVRVAVADGRVALQRTHPRAGRRDLHPGELGTLAPGDLDANVRGADVTAILGWTEGRLAFDDAPLPDVLRQIARWYPVQFTTLDSTDLTARLTGVIDIRTGATVDDILRSIGPLMHVRFDRHGTTYTVRRLQDDPA